MLWCVEIEEISTLCCILVLSKTIKIKLICLSRTLILIIIKIKIGHRSFLLSCTRHILWYRIALWLIYCRDSIILFYMLFPLFFSFLLKANVFLHFGKVICSQIADWSWCLLVILLLLLWSCWNSTAARLAYKTCNIFLFDFCCARCQIYGWNLVKINQ